MSDYPPQVERLKQAVLSLPGVAACEVGLKRLDQYEPQHMSLPGEFADLPHVAIYRTNGGLDNEALLHVEFMVWQSCEGWAAIEFLAWWARDQGRGGERVQCRSLALPPKGYEPQLGRTLKFVLEVFLLIPGESMEPILKKADELAEDIEESIDMYRDEIDHPVLQAETPELW